MSMHIPSGVQINCNHLHHHLCQHWITGRSDVFACGQECIFVKLKKRKDSNSSAHFMTKSFLIQEHAKRS